MTSELKMAANRMNARKSRGPRSAAAKARVSRNALRHGFAALKHLPVMRSRHVENMASAICGIDTNPLLFEQALVIAESTIILACIGPERLAVIGRLRDITAVPLSEKDNSFALAEVRLREMELASDEFQELKAKFDAMSVEEQEKLLDEYELREAELEAMRPLVKERDEFDAMRAAMPDLDRLARYEWRARSRQKRAIRAFIKIKSESSGRNDEM
jgi:hypothetical protein